MAFWQTSSISGINIGSSPNDGTGDDIRDAFLKVDTNFSNLSSFLNSTSSDFLNANVEFNLNVNTANVTNLLTENTVGTTASFTNSVTANTVTSNNALTSLGTSSFIGNVTAANVTVTGQTDLMGPIVAHHTIVPSANLAYDLGSSTSFFNNIYTRGLVVVNTVSLSAAASLLELQSNVVPGTVQDVGVFGKYYKNGANLFGFFGTQFSTQDFVYKITGTDTTLGNSVVYDGTYGNSHFGSQFLSNTTPSTNTASGALIVAGGVGVAGNINAGANITAPTFIGNTVSTVANIGRMSVSGSIAGALNVDGNIYSNSYQVITTNYAGIGSIINSTGSLFTGNAVFAAGTSSYSPVTGAIVIPTGGLGVGGNINTSGNVVTSANVTAGSLVGPYYGTIQTAAQPNITSVGTLSSLNAGSSSFTSVGTTTLLVSGATSLNGSTQTAVLVATGNVTAPYFLGNLNATNITTANLNATTVTAPSLNGNVTATNVLVGNLTATNITTTNFVGTILTAAQPNITSVGNLTAPAFTTPGNVTGNVGVFNSLSIGGPSTSNGIFDNGNRVVSVTSGTGNLTINANSISLTTTGPGANSYGSPTTIPVFSTDIYGRFVSATTTAVNAPAGQIIGSTLSSNVTASSLTSVGTLSSLSTNGAVLVNGAAQIGGSSSALGVAYVGGGTQFGITLKPTTDTTTAINFFNAAGTSIGTISQTASTIQFNGSGAGLTGTAPSLSIGGTAATATTAAGSSFYTNGSGTENQVGVQLTGYNSAYLYSNASAWGLYSISGGSIINYNRSTGLVSIGTVAGLSSSGSISPTANVAYNLGSSTAWWNGIYGTAVHAQYADLAENYQGDYEYAPGTVVVFGGEKEITTTTEFADASVAGAISTDPAYLMNGATPGLPLALRGRVPCQVVGPVTKGDSLVTSNVAGFATSVGKDRTYGQAVFAKALETNLDAGGKIIEVVIL